MTSFVFLWTSPDVSKWTSLIRPKSPSLDVQECPLLDVQLGTLIYVHGRSNDVISLSLDVHGRPKVDVHFITSTDVHGRLRTSFPAWVIFVFTLSFNEIFNDLSNVEVKR